MQFLHALAGVFSLLIVVALGYYLARLGWFPEQTRKMLPKLVTNVSLPPFLGCTIVSSFERDNMLHMLSGIAAPFLAIVIMFAAAWIIGRLIGVQRRHFGLFCASVSNSNTIFIGIPVNLALFGPEAMPYVLLYYFAATVFFWTVGNYFISRDAAAPQARGIHWRQIISPPLYGFIAGLLIVGLDLRTPAFIFQAAQITGQMTTPLALIFIGVTLQGMRLSRLGLNRDIVAAAIGRMLASPLLMLGMASLFQLPELMARVFVIQSGLPVLMQVAILSAYYGTDPDYGSIMVSLTTIICAVTIPLWMTLI